MEKNGKQYRSFKPIELVNYGLMSSQHFGHIEMHGPWFNPIALRKTKIVYNFGNPECSRVKISSERPEEREIKLATPGLVVKCGHVVK